MNDRETGRVNAHTHIYSGLCPLDMPAPAVQPTTFTEILERVWWRLDRALDERALRSAARLYAAEALLEGTTGLIDHHESPEFIEGSLDVIADACQELGMRALICYGVTERNGGRDEAQRGLAECRRFIESNTRPLVRGAVGVHAGFTVSDETLREAGELARELGTIVHLHVAEDETDGRDAIERGYQGAIDRLIKLDAVPPGSILAHGVHLSANEVRMCCEYELWLVQNPRSNLNNRVGYPAALGEATLVALGTDGFPADMVTEAEMLILQAASHGEDIDRAALRLGAGRRLFAPHFNGAAETQTRVSQGTVTIGEREVVSKGTLVCGDLQAIRAQAREDAQRLWAKMETI